MVVFLVLASVWFPIPIVLSCTQAKMHAPRRRVAAALFLSTGVVVSHKIVAVSYASIVPWGLPTGSVEGAQGSER